MIRIRLLGTLDITTASGKPADAVLAGPKRLALVTYLSIADGGSFHRRDILVALLWPELD